MHELSIALSIIEGVEEELTNRAGRRVEAIHLRLGPLSGVVKEALLFSFDVASAGTRAEGARLEIEETPVILYCARCECEVPAISIQNLRCARCGTPGADLRGGAELQLFALELSPVELSPVEPPELSCLDTDDEHRAEAG